MRKERRKQSLDRTLHKLDVTQFEKQFQSSKFEVHRICGFNTLVVVLLLLFRLHCSVAECYNFETLTVIYIYMYKLGMS